jgi:hypothetical protein
VGGRSSGRGPREPQAAAAGGGDDVTITKDDPGDRARREISLGFGMHGVPEGQHICFLYSSDEERLDITARFLTSGILARERVLHLTDTITVDEVTRRLGRMGVDLSELGRALVLGDATAASCPHGRFVPSDMIDALREFYAGARADGYSGARGTGEMTWSVRGNYDLDDLMDYEARLNDALRDHPFTACCQYDLRRFDGQAIMDLLSVHPLSLVGGQLVSNPYYVEPATFLARTRRRTQGHA